jgi:hypothetical protein
MWLPNLVVDAVEREVRIAYVAREVASYWNQRRDREDKDDVCVFTGWYWLNGTKQGGPFRSRSAAYRDAWFQVVHKQPPPTVNPDIPRRPNRKGRA